MSIFFYLMEITENQKTKKTASPALLIHGGGIWIHTLLFLMYKSRIRASSSAPPIIPL